MSLENLHTRYAQAYYHWAQQKGIVPHLRQDITHLQQVYDTLASFRHFLKNPCYKPKEKVAILTKMFSRDLHPMTSTFLSFLTMKRRIEHLPGILKALALLDRTQQHIRTAYLTTATPISPTLKENIIRHIQTITAHTGAVELITKEEPSLIGGYLLKIRDQQLDMTIRTQLTRLQHHWEQSPPL